MATTAEVDDRTEPGEAPAEPGDGQRGPGDHDDGGARAHLGNMYRDPLPLTDGYVPEPADRERCKSRCLRWLRTYSIRQAAKGCMIDPVAAAVKITVDAGTGRGHVSGVKRCASPWACPVCSFTIRNRRAREITELVEKVEARGHSVMMLTLTVPHAAREPLDALLGTLNAAQRSLWSGRSAQAFRRRWNIAGQVRAVEITWGAKHGWNPHVHALLILERPPLDNAEWVRMWGELYFAWQTAVVAAGGRMPNAYGVNLAAINDPRDVAAYVTDAGGWTVGAEVAQGPVKLGRSSGRWAPFALLAAAAMWGDVDAGDLWMEYELATAGKRAIVASRGLYDAYGVGVAGDEEAAVEDVREVLAVVEVDPMMWLCLAAVDQCRAYVGAVEQWAVAGCQGRPPDPGEWYVEQHVRHAGGTLRRQ